MGTWKGGWNKRWVGDYGKNKSKEDQKTIDNGNKNNDQNNDDDDDDNLIDNMPNQADTDWGYGSLPDVDTAEKKAFRQQYFNAQRLDTLEKEHPFAYRLQRSTVLTLFSLLGLGILSNAFSFGAAYSGVSGSIGTAGATGTGGTATAQGIKLLGSPKMAKHHIFPQQFKKVFQKIGIIINDFTVSIPQKTTHLKGVHGKGFNNMPGQWNSMWSDFIMNNPNATIKDFYQFAGYLMDKFGLSGLEIVKYK